jgi:hypothetical protein
LPRHAVAFAGGGHDQQVWIERIHGQFLSLALQQYETRRHFQILFPSDVFFGQPRTQKIVVLLPVPGGGYQEIVLVDQGHRGNIVGQQNIQ